VASAGDGGDDCFPKGPIYPKGKRKKVDGFIGIKHKKKVKANPQPGKVSKEVKGVSPNT
jgi:hypothetical protein